jgi:dolichol-phosphate mannosyltransferase
MKDFNIIVPTLNEEENIQPLLQKIHNSCHCSKYSFEVIFVDDGSTDNTRQEIHDYVGPLDVRLVRRDTEKGLVTAVLEGAAVASSEIIVVIDADLSHPPEKILQLVEPLFAGQCDMVIGSRYVQNGKITDWLLTRRIGSWAASIPARILTGVKDPLSGFFAVKKDILLKVDPSVGGYKIGLEILGREDEKLRVREIPIHFKDRSAGFSKMTMQVTLEYVVQLFSLYGVNIHFSSFRPFFSSLVLAGGADAIIYSTLNRIFQDPIRNHIFSYFLVFHLFFLGLILYQKRLDPTVKRQRINYLSFLNIACLGLFLRGGLLAISGSAWGTNSVQTTLILSVTTALTVIFCWVAYSSGSGRTLPETNPKAFIVTLIAYSLTLRFLFLATPELLQEEAYYWNYAQHMSGGYLDHPPGVAVLIWLGTALFGNNEFGVRSGAFICWFITAGFTYKLVQSIFNSAAALCALLLVAVLPVFFSTGLVITPDAPLVASWAGALYFLHGALVKERSRSWFGAGMCLGVGLASKYTIAFLGPAILLFMLMDPRSRKLFFRPHPYLAALLAIVIFSPVILWNYQHEWASFLFQSKDRLTAASEFSTHELLISIIVLLTPTGFLAVLFSLKRTKYTITDRSNSSDYRSRCYTFCLVMAFVPLLIFFLFSLTKAVKLSWTGPLWLSLLPLIAYSMDRPQSRLDSIIARSWRPTVVICVLIYGSILHYWSIGLPGVHFKEYPFLLGWQNMAAQVENIVQTISEDEGQRPVVVATGTYRIASGLAFYRYKGVEEDPVNHYQKKVVGETTSSHIFGHNSLMYQYWHKPEDLSNNSLVVIARKKHYLSPAYLQERYSSLGPIKLINHSKSGKLVGTYYYRHINYLRQE